MDLSFTPVASMKHRVEDTSLVNHSRGQAKFILPANANANAIQILQQQFATVDECSTPANRSRRTQLCDIKIGFPFAGSIFHALQITILNDCLYQDTTAV